MLSKEMRIVLTGDAINLTDHRKHMVHVQSFAYCLSREAIQFLIKIHFFSENKFFITNDKGKVIHHYEIGLSTRLIKNGWCIKAFRICMNTPKNEFDKIKNVFCSYGVPLFKKRRF